MKPNLHVIHETTLNDVPGKLRELAADIEKGEYGEVTCCGVSLFADELNVFGFGLESNGASVCLVMQAAVQELADTLRKKE